MEGRHCQLLRKRHVVRDRCRTFSARVVGPPISDADRRDEPPFATGTQGALGRVTLGKKQKGGKGASRRVFYRASRSRETVNAR